jgi:hypothetical protein
MNGYACLDGYGAAITHLALTVIGNHALDGSKGLQNGAIALDAGGLAIMPDGAHSRISRIVVRISPWGGADSLK